MSEKTRHYLAAFFGAAAVVSMLQTAPPAPAPTPDSNPPKIVLAGKFIGPTAAEDAACVAALCDEFARIVTADGERDTPRLKTGVQFDELRIAARENRTGGVSIGDRQPKARDEIRHFLEEALGISGGPVTPEQRAKWADAFMAISRAASRAAGK